jgi:hypothetical protein
LAHKQKLNDRQLQLLGRIAASTEPVTSQEYTLAATVYALRSRGLVTTARRPAGTWVAAVTEAGRHYLEHGAYPPRNETRSSAAFRTSASGPEHRTRLDPAALVARVAASGGTLVIADPGPTTRARWLGAIQRAVLAGHRLHHTGRRRGDVVITLEHAVPGVAQPPAERVGRTIRRAPVGPLPRTKPHPLVAELQALLPAPTDSPAAVCARLDPRLPPVARPTLPRALRVLQLLFTQAEARGHAVRPADRSDQRRAHVFHLVLYGHAYPMAVVEYDGVLVLKLDGLFSGRRIWGDGVRTRLEHKIGDVLACLELRAEQAEQRRREREALQRVHEQAREAKAAQYRAIFAQQYATTVLSEQVAHWRLARDIRALAAQIQEQSASDSTASHDTRAWLAWALAQADRIDPAAQPLAVPHIPEPTPQDLARYLDQQPRATPEAHA